MFGALARNGSSKREQSKCDVGGRDISVGGER